MDQTTIAGLAILTFKLGIFAMLVLHTRQAARTAEEAREADADDIMRQSAVAPEHTLRKAA